MTSTPVIDAADVPEVRDALRRLGPLMHERLHEVIFVRDGDSVIAVVELQPRQPDAETRALTRNPEFRALIDHARQQIKDGLVLSHDDMRLELGIADEEIAAERERRRRRPQA